MIQALVVDDNREVADVICQLLGLMEVNARAAYGARACILELREMTPDIIFIDVNMPGLDGFEVISYLRREPRLAEVPFAVVTADMGLETEMKAHKLGAVDRIIKPATFEALECTLRAVNLL